ncbi:hypothetical protein RJ639_000057 [Escallonia herrerae]|uniref:Retroviral polymerase SH3-like domain-containing protein n=1 Tax=Escallonia herrerae TaxID=1293975 RepID=A0AA88XBF6_9ASTE|nr:hypothetical protein RJ639_000057 [Escallonia herrerae]
MADKGVSKFNMEEVNAPHQGVVKRETPASPRFRAKIGSLFPKKKKLVKTMMGELIDVLPLYPGRLSSRTVSTVAGRISLKDSESNSCLGSPLLFITMATSETNPESGPVNTNMQHNGGTVYATPYVAPARGSVGLGERPKKFNGKDFKRWQQKMLFYLTTLNLASPMVNTKALWESLERKYKTEDVGSKKFVVGKFLDFKMVDSKTEISQVQEFQLILHDIHAEGMVLGESFQVAALIEKLPPTWKDFKNYLKHKRKEMKLEDLIVRLRIEEDNRQSEKKASNYHQEAKANVVEQVDGIFIGYASHSSAYRFLVHKSEVDDIHVNTIMETRNAHFFEDVFPYKVAQERSSLERTSMNQDPSQEEDEPRRSKRARTSTSFGPDFLTFLLENEPRTYSEAMSNVLPLYPGRLSSRTVSTVAGRISLKDSESNSRLGSPLLFV